MLRINKNWGVKTLTVLIQIESLGCDVLMCICLRKYICLFFIALSVTSRNLTLLLWSPRQQHPLPSAPLHSPRCVITAVWGTTQWTRPKHTPGLKIAFLLVGLSPSITSSCTSTTQEAGQRWSSGRPGRAAGDLPCGCPPALVRSCLSRSPRRMASGTTCPCSCSFGKDQCPHGLCASPSSLENKGFSIRWHFLAYYPAVEYSCPLRTSQANAMVVSWPRNYPARSSLSILHTFKFATYVGFKRERRARSPGGQRRTAIPIHLQAGEKPQRPSVLPPSKQTGTRAGGPLLHRPERDRGGCSRGGSQTEPKPPPGPPSLAVLYFLYFFLAEHHFTHAQKEEQKTWTNYQTN